MRKIIDILNLCRIQKLGVILPFAIISALLLCDKNIKLPILIYIILALSCGFMAGCAFNGFTDKTFDAKNPRTNKRPMAQKNVSTTEVIVVISTLIVLTVFFTYLIYPPLVMLLPIPAVLCGLYSFSKRFTWLCHVLIGIVHAICPVSVAIVFHEILNIKTVLITMLVAFTTTETDILYSIDDVKYDVALKLKSIPAVFGTRIAMGISIFIFLLSAVVQVILFAIVGFDALSTVVVVVANLLLLSNHVLKYFGKICSQQIMRSYRHYIYLLAFATAFHVI